MTEPPENRNANIVGDREVMFCWRGHSRSGVVKPGRINEGGSVVGPPERREIPAEVQFEVTPNTVSNITDLRSARLRTWQGQQWEEQVVARLKLSSCRRPEPIELGLRCRYRFTGRSRNCKQSHLFHEALDFVSTLDKILFQLRRAMPNNYFTERRFHK
jgi:hypothetical protein